MKIESLNGQDMANLQIDSLLRFTERNDGPMRPVLIHGPSGTGKTRASHIISQSLAEQGFEVLRFDDAGVIRLASDFKSMIARPAFGFREETKEAPATEGEDGETEEETDFPAPSGRIAIILDECQKIIGSDYRGNGVSAIVYNAFRSMVYPHGDGVKNSVLIPMANGETAVVDFTRVLLIFMTNEPEKLETSASLRKGEFPFRRRFYSIELLPYHRDKMKEIIPVALAENGLKAADCSQRLILDFHRCTMESVSSLIAAHKFRFPDKRVLSKESVLEAAKLTPWFPCGINRREAQLLRRLHENSGTMKVSLVASALGCEPKNVRAAISHLYGQQVEKDGERIHTPFVEMRGSNVEITARGRKYLAAIIQDQFNF